MVLFVFWKQFVYQVVFTFYQTAQVNYLRDYRMGTLLRLVQQHFLLLFITVVSFFLSNGVYSDADERFQNLAFHIFICEASLKYQQYTCSLFQSRSLLASLLDLCHNLDKKYQYKLDCSILCFVQSSEKDLAVLVVINLTVNIGNLNLILGTLLQTVTYHLIVLV